MYPRPGSHPLHLVLDLTQTTASGQGGKLWIGGETASSDLQLLQRHGISVVAPAARSPVVAESMDLTVFPQKDGTGITQGDIPLDSVTDIVDSIVNELLAGRSVIITCKNGAHRSAVLTILTLIRMTGLGALTLMNYLCAVRNICDFNSFPPARGGRVNPCRPRDFLLAEETAKVFMPGVGPVSRLQELVSPAIFRGKCLALGFTTVPPATPSAPSAGLRPVLVQGERGDTASVASSFVPIDDDGEADGLIQFFALLCLIVSTF